MLADRHLNVKFVAILKYKIQNLHLEEGALHAEIEHEQESQENAVCVSKMSVFIHSW